jgi:HJR/Mrr/RecB family endonuclease
MNKDTFACIACGEYYPESEIQHFTNGEAICIHCNSRMQKYNTLNTKTMMFDESKRPKFKHENKYGKMDDIYNVLLNTNELLMDGITFEYFCADLLLIEGFKNVEVTKASADNGVDITAEKNNKKYIFQCKCLTHTCSNKAVQEIVSANTIYHADYMGVICNTKFSTQARVLANNNGVQLYSLGNIKHILDKYSCDFYEV